MVCLNIQPMTPTLSKYRLCQLLLTISMNGKHFLYLESCKLSSKVCLLPTYLRMEKRLWCGSGDNIKVGLERHVVWGCGLDSSSSRQSTLLALLNLVMIF
jgi:hypothetical protein